MTVTKGLVVRLEARPGEEAAVADFLRGAVPLVQREPATVAWFAFRTGDSSFAIVDAFSDEDGRDAHLIGWLDAVPAPNRRIFSGSDWSSRVAQ